MKSIRRTLISNLTLLLVVALGAVAVLVYRITRDAIQEKQNTAREQVQMQFVKQRNDAMLAQARALVSDAQSQFDPVKFRQYFEVAPLGIYSMAFGANSYITAPIWLAERLPGPLSYRLNLLLATDLKLNDSEAMTHGYVQVNSDWGNIWRSKALSGPTLPLDVAQFNSEERFQWIFDEIEVTPGSKAHRVRLKAPLNRARIAHDPSAERATQGAVSGLRHDPFRSLWSSDSRSVHSRPAGTSRPPGPPPAFGSYLPTLYVQVAWDSTTNDPFLHKLEEIRDQQLQELDSENQQAMANLRRQLIWIGVATFGIVVLGGWLLIGAGLAPLKRLSHAVSRVSAKDFKLPLEPKELPREVSPVVERLQQTLQQLSEAFAREKRASADISHELRTPLAALTTTLEVALRKPRSADDYRQTIDDARQIARQMSQLVERMLALAWLDAGADEVRLQSVDIDALVDGCAAIGKPLAEAQGLKFRLDAERPLTAHTDPDKVREVVMNLLHNAIEYNQPGGQIEISARSAAAGIVLEVRDTGIGIPLELQDKIFERFYRGDPSRNAVGVHAGLGLAIVKEYVDRLGGRLSIESAVGAGSRFRVELPNG